ncbi:MAG: transporter substrate-binding domain-containing protein [Verrucomicrobiota bacterium]
MLTWLLCAGAFAEQEHIRVGICVSSSTEECATDLLPRILETIAEQQQWTIEHIHETQQACSEQLRVGDIDLMLDTTCSLERSGMFWLSEESALIGWDRVYARSDISIQSFRDLEGKTIATSPKCSHPTEHEDIKSIMSRMDIDCNFIEVGSHLDIFMLLDAKLADAGIVSHLSGTHHADEYDVAATPIIFNPRSHHFAAAKDSERGRQLLSEIDQCLRDLKKNSAPPDSNALPRLLDGSRHDWWCSSQSKGKIKLSESEKEWLKEHPVIRIGIDPGFAPFEFLSEDNGFQGMAADFMDLISKKTGIKFNLAQSNGWSDCIQAIQKHELDVLPCIGISTERTKFLAYTKPYLKFARVIVAPIDSPVQGLEDLEGLRIGVQQDSSHHAFLKEHTSLQPKLYKTFEEVVLAVSREEIDAAIGNLAVTTHIMRNLALTNIKLAAHAAAEPQTLCIGIRKDWPELAPILNRAIETISMQERNAIMSKWLTLPQAADHNLDLSQEEREWLLLHPRIRVAWDPEWAPIEFADAKGHPHGVSMEYLKAIEAMLGIHFSMDEADSWQEAYTKLKNREIDMSSCVAVTRERLTHLDFTPTYLSSPVVLFGGNNMAYIRDMDELRRLRVAVVEHYAPDNWITHDYPELNLTRTSNITEAFKLLKKGKVDVFAGNVITGNYYLSKLRYHDIKITGSTPYSYKLRMAVRKDWPVFSGILRKALASLPEEDQTAFYRKWVWLKYEYGFNYSLFWKILAVCLVVIAAFAYWNRRLASEIRSREQAEKALSESKSKLRTSYANLQKMEELKDDLMHMVAHDMRSPLTAIGGILDIFLTELKQNKHALDDRELLLLAKSSSLSLTGMIQSLLDVSRLETHQMALNPLQIDLHEIAERAKKSLHIHFLNSGQNLHLSGTPAKAVADPEIIERVFTNLIENAIKATEKSETIEVHTSESATMAIAEVRDTGHGIPAEQQHLVFEKFSSLQNGSMRKISSIGLGLAFCKLAVEAHGGKINVESTEGEGTTFRIEIPRTPTT